MKRISIQKLESIFYFSEDEEIKIEIGMELIKRYAHACWWQKLEGLVNDESIPQEVRIMARREIERLLPKRFRRYKKIYERRYF